MNIIQADNLVKNYGRAKAVDGISFDVAEKEIFALIGPNGAGKSTTLRILATLLSPTSGSVKVDGLDITKDASKIREIISYLPEEAGAYKNLSGIGYLSFMAGLYFDDVKKRKEAVEFGKEISGLGNRLKDKISTYSKGMSRKILLARTVMAKPKLAILDEPTSGLDVLNAFAIRSTIKQLSQHGMSVLLSSHNMLEIEFLSNRVGMINQGKIIEIGAPNELKQRHKASNLEEVFVKMVEEK